MGTQFTCAIISSCRCPGRREVFGTRSARDAVILVLLTAVGWLHGVANGFGAPQEAWQKVAAQASDFAVWVGDVDHHLNQALPPSGLVDANARSVARAQTLELLLGRWAILQAADDLPQWPGKSLRAAAVEQRQAELTATGLTVEAFAHEQKISPQHWRATAEWQYAWTTYCQRIFDEATLREIFESQQREFDGTQFLVEQIVWSPDEPRGAEIVRQVKTQIERGELEFAAAARQYSQAPSGATGGRLGWITRQSPMPDLIGAAVVTLSPGDLSQPVRSPLGWHLLRVVEIQPGSRSFLDCREAVERWAIQAEFQRLVALHRPQLTVEYAPDFPRVPSPPTRSTTGGD